MTVCRNCEHFDKDAWPKNASFGKCNYILPNLPKWVHVTDELYRSVNIDLANCGTYSARDAARKDGK